jgi:hypothetical protein
MAIEILWLTDRSAAEAKEEAERLIDLRTGPSDLSKLLVLDHAGLLADHTAVFRQLTSSRRVENLVCVAIGPFPEQARGLPLLPDSLAGAHGPGVLWVSDPDGIDWRDAPGTKVIGRKRGQPDGLERLVQLLHIETVFDKVYETFEYRVRYRVASPGLRLAGADDETATFKAALALAIAQLKTHGSGDEGPFRSLLPDEGAVLMTADGQLAGYRAEVADAAAAAEARAAKQAGASRLFRRGDGGMEEHVRATGAALGQLRERVIYLFRTANTTKELTSNQREVIRNGGLQFSQAPQTSQSAGDESEPERSPAFRAIIDALDGGDTLPLIQRRLTATSKAIRRHGSATYLPQVDVACSASLPVSLGAVAEVPSATLRSGPAAVRQWLGLDAADQAASALLALVVEVAAREWVPAAAESDELDHGRIAIAGIQLALSEYAAAVPHVHASRLVRLSESLLPVLRALVRQVLQDAYGSPAVVGQDTMDDAQRWTQDQLTAWTDLVQAHGVSTQPKFAPPTAVETMYTVESDVAAIRDALLTEPRAPMWQLCGQNDVTVLDPGPAPLAVRFASGQYEHDLAAVVPRDTMWISSGSLAGLLRLVPLRSEIVAGNPLPEEANSPEPE